MISSLHQLGQGEGHDNGRDWNEVEPEARIEDFEDSVDETEELLDPRAICPPADADVALLVRLGSPIVAVPVSDRLCSLFLSEQIWISEFRESFKPRGASWADLLMFTRGVII